MDGSASPFVFLIQSAGLVEQGELKKFIRVKKEVRVERGDTYAAIKPFDGFKVSFEIDFDDATIKQHSQKSSIDFSKGPVIFEVKSSKTRLPNLFQNLKYWKKLKKVSHLKITQLFNFNLLYIWKQLVMILKVLKYLMWSPIFFHRP